MPIDNSTPFSGGSGIIEAFQPLIIGAYTQTHWVILKSPIIRLTTTVCVTLELDVYQQFQLYCNYHGTSESRTKLLDLIDETSKPGYNEYKVLLKQSPDTSMMSLDLVWTSTLGTTNLTALNSISITQGICSKGCIRYYINFNIRLHIAG